MATFNTATALLNKRCDYIEGKLSLHSELIGKAPAGKQYKHFVLQGLVHAGFYSPVHRGLQTPAGTAQSAGVSTISDMHLSELAVFETEEKLVDQPVKLQTLRDFGLDLSNYPSNDGLGQTMRLSALYAPIMNAYDSTYGMTPNYTLDEHMTSHYKGRELIPVDAEASWDVQAENLLYQARSFPIKDLLGAQHIIADDGKAGAFSLRRAGFPVPQFQGDPEGKNVSPHSVYHSPADAIRPLDDMAWPIVVRHCPSIILVTIECPDNLDELIAGEGTDDVALTYYFKHIMVPHWVGLANIFDHKNNGEGEEGKPLSQSRLYDPSMVSHFADVLTSASIGDIDNDNGNAHGDLIIFTPSDDSLASTEPLALGDARSFMQNKQYTYHQSLEGKVAAAAYNASARYGGATQWTVFTDNPTQWMQKSGGSIHSRFVTKEQFTVRGLTIANGGPSRKYGRTVSLYTKPADHPNGASLDGNWELHESISFSPTTAAVDVFFSKAAPSTNIFYVEFTDSDEGGYTSMQHVAFITASDTPEDAV
ncbi:MAG: hypothetical protein GY833_22775 [Aestuariibacter sp.]|nr:hypothetical protein [Aestuariibacter sp.]|tara:strand:+ start:212245 stop:213849 length:1605 start_codon:yes stop_codon:yes gene_type:complete